MMGGPPRGDKCFLRARVDGEVQTVASAHRVPTATQLKFDKLNSSPARGPTPAESALVPFRRVQFFLQYANGVAYHRAAGLFDPSQQQVLLDVFRFDYKRVGYIPNGPDPENIAGDRLRAQGPLLYSVVGRSVAARDGVVASLVRALDCSLGARSNSRVVQLRVLCTYPGALAQRPHTDFQSETWSVGQGSSLFVGLMPATLNINGIVVSYDVGDVLLVAGNVEHCGTSLDRELPCNVRLFCFVDAVGVRTFFTE
jgi:hypothetical protein